MDEDDVFGLDEMVLLDDPACEEGGVWGDDVDGSVMGEGGSAWSAWEVGTAFALGGWLLDVHAEQVGRRVQEALEQAGVVRAHGQQLRFAPHPAPAHEYSFHPTLAPLEVGALLEQGQLFGDVAVASAYKEPLMVQAEGATGDGGRLVLVVTVLPGSAGPMVWVVAELHPGGFRASRLVPVFQPDPSGDMAIFATDFAAEAVDAVRWACEREGRQPGDLTVTRRS